MTIPIIVGQVVQELQRIQGDSLPPPASMSLAFLAEAEILGQDPGLRRDLGTAGKAVFAAWIAAAGKEQRLTIAAGSGQIGKQGDLVPIAVRVTDAFNRPVQGVQVTFTVAAANGTVAPTTATTDSTGVASGVWTLGTAKGLIQLKASLAHGPSVTFTALSV